MSCDFILDTSLINSRNFGLTPNLLRDAQVTGILLRARELRVSLLEPGMFGSNAMKKDVVHRLRKVNIKRRWVVRRRKPTNQKNMSTDKQTDQ